VDCFAFRAIPLCPKERGHLRNMMSEFGSKRVLKSAAIVFGFWAFTFAIYFADYGVDITFAICVIAVIILCWWIAKNESVQYRLAIHRSLAPSEDRGVHSNIGRVAFASQPLPMAKKLDYELLRKHFPPEFSPGPKDVLAQYREKYQHSHPEFVYLFESILRLLTAPEHIAMPATYGLDSTTNEPSKDAILHGGRSLLTHSLLVFCVGINEAASFFSGYKPSSALAANDLSYKPNPEDPLIGILCLAHDIGKLRTFRLSKTKDGKLIAQKIARRHDIAGCKVLSAMREFWEVKLGQENRSILQNIMSFYHHPDQISINPAKPCQATEKYQSDREMALLALLIHADNMAGKIERGITYENAQEQSKTSVATAESTALPEKADMYDAFLNYLSFGNAPINNAQGKSVALKTTYRQKTLLVFNEHDFLSSFLDYLDKPALKDISVSGKEVHPVTALLLKQFDEKGILYRVESNSSTEGRAAQHCIYACAWFDLEKSETVPAFKFGSIFILDITDHAQFALYQSLSDCRSSPQFSMGRFGSMGTKERHRKSTSDAIVADLFMTSEVSQFTDIHELIKNSRPNLQGSSPIVLSVAPTQSLIAPMLVKGSIKIAMGRKELIAHSTFSDNEQRRFAIFVNCDDWFNSNIGPISKLSEPSYMEKAGIKEVKLSQQYQGKHVITVALE
jgi:hypothetical protein